MKKLAKFTTTSILASSLLLSSIPAAQAQILPKTDKNTRECIQLMQQEWRQKFESGSTTKEERDRILGCSIKTGNIKLWMFPFFITYLINFVLALAGLISVLFLVFGGYQYVIGSAQGQTDKGKNAIFYAVVGLIVTLMAWILVNIVQSAVT